MTTTSTVASAIGAPSPAAGGGPARTAAGAASMPVDHFWVDVVDAEGFAAEARAWMSLAGRAGVPNVFMDPAVALAAQRSGPRPVKVLLGWYANGPTGSEPRLAGVWIFVINRPRLTWPWTALASPVNGLASLGTPVLDPDLAGPTLQAMLTTIRLRPDLPHLVQAGDMTDGDPVMDTLRLVLTRGRMASTLIERRRRAKLQTAADVGAHGPGTMSEHRLQGLARKRRQLGECGKLEFASIDAPAAVAAGLEEFLQLETFGWMAARESALASDPAAAAFARTMVTGLAERRLAAIQSLRLNGRAIAMCVILRSGSGAFTWRAAHDARYRRYAPEVLLLEDMTAHLLADPAVTTTDSCNRSADGYQAERWAGRQDVVDLLIDVIPGRSPRVLLLGLRERLLRRAASLARHIRHGVRDLTNAVARGLAGSASPSAHKRSRRP